MKKQHYLNKSLKNTLKPLFIMGFFVLTFQQSFANSKEMLNMLSEEANNTKMSNKKAENEPENKVDNEPKITVELNNNAADDDLSAKIEGQLRRVLSKEKEAGKDDAETKKETEAALEKIVSSSLLEGAKMDDIRSAVSDAMAEIKGDKSGEAIAPELITEADKAFSKLTITKKTPEVASVTTVAKGKDKSKGKEKDKAETPIEHPETVTVKAGESLFKIALRVYGDGNKYYKLYKANEESIKDPNILQAGQVLVTPKFK